MVISCLYVQTVTHQCFCFPNSQWGVTAYDIKDPLSSCVVEHMCSLFFVYFNRSNVKCQLGIVSLASSIAATAGTNIIKTAIVFVH